MKKLIPMILFFISANLNAIGPCAIDVKKFCPTVEKNKAKIMECVMKHEGQLTAGCKERVKTVKEKGIMGGKNKDTNIQAQVSKVKENCANDVKKFCKTERKSKGAIMTCLKKNMSALEPACKAVISNIKSN